VIANIIRKKGAGGWNLLLHYADQSSTDGRRAPFLRLEASGTIGPRNWELSFDPGKFLDDGYGDGPLRDLNPDGSLRASALIHSQGYGTQLPLIGAFETPFYGGQLRVNARIFSQAFNANEQDTFDLPPGLTQHDHVDDNKFQTEFGGRFVRPFGPRLNAEFVALRQDHHETTADDFQGPGGRDVFKLVQYFRNLDHFPHYSRVRKLFFSGEPPASTVVEVSAMLPSADILIEVEATAYLPTQPSPR